MWEWRSFKGREDLNLIAPGSELFKFTLRLNEIKTQFPLLTSHIPSVQLPQEPSGLLVFVS